jgi:ADP-ribosylglycohydrolase
MRTEPSRLERFRGCLLGLAVGDALGAPLIGMKAAHVRQVYGEIDGYVDAALAWKGRPHKWALPGLYTCNTQRALVIADILAQEGRCEPRALADVFVEMADAHVERTTFGCHRRVSRNFRLALERMKSPTADPLDCGGPSAGCGAAARVAPIGLYYSNKPDLLTRAVIETSLVTHRDARAVAAALAVANAIAHFVSDAAERCSRPAETARLLADQVRRGEAVLIESYSRHLIRLEDRAASLSISTSLDLLPRLLDEADDTLAYESIVREANRCAPQQPVHDPSEGFAPAVLTTALYLALSGRSFAQAVAAAVGLGRQAHDLGAIVGAILGARDGEEAIPALWLSNLCNSEQVRLRADNLDRGDIDYSRWCGVVSLESEATAAEERERRRLAGLWEKKGLLVKKKRRVRPQQEKDLGFAPPPDTWLRRKADRVRAERRPRRKERG